MMNGKLTHSFIFMLLLLVSALAYPVVNANRKGVHPREVAVLEQEFQNNLSDLDLISTGWAGEAYRLVLDESESPTSVSNFLPKDLTKGDFNEDGRPDVVTVYAGVGSSQLSLRLSLEPGEFSVSSYFELAGGFPTAMAVEDVNLDGHLDVLVGFEDSDVVSLLEGTGRGSFAPAKEIAIGAPVHALATADVDKDAYPDLVVASSSTQSVSLLRGTPSGFEAPMTLYSWPSWVGFSPVALYLADVDQDEALDIILARRQILEVLFAADVYEPTTMATAGDEFSSLVLGDLNNDGVKDLVVAENRGDLKVLLSDPALGLQSPVTLSTGVQISHLTLAHLNEDGYLDLVLIGNSQEITFVLGDGRGGFRVPSKLKVGGMPTTAMVMRLNKDALDDLVIATDGGGAVTLAVSAPADIMVTTTRDVSDIPTNGQVSHLPGPDGQVSLREAMLAANNTPGPQTIAFNIPRLDPGFNGSVFRIQMTSALPELSSGGTTIDGFSQTLATGDTNPAGPEVVLDGKNAGRNVDGVLITSALNVVQGLVIQNFSGSGVKMVVRANQNIIAGNYIGTDETGTQARPNQFYGVIVASNASQSNLIGGTVFEDRNVISGNSLHGVALQFPTFDNRIVGNYIGTTAPGTAALPNGGNGVFLTSVRENLIGGTVPGARNLISGNIRNGISIEAGLNNQIAGNYIGTDINGSVAIANGQNGIVVSTGSDSTLIGGTSPWARNVISGNLLHGVEITTNSVNTNLFGNLVGTNQSGAMAVGNGGNGVTINAAQTLVGGFTIQTRNVVAGNAGHGILIGNGASFNNLLGNYVGVNVTGAVMLPNGDDGVAIKHSSNNIVGGPDPGRGNVIAGNQENGVNLTSASNNRIVGNFIGTNVDQTLRLGNGGNGVLLQDSPSNIIEANTITASGQAGVTVLGASTFDRITRNAIFANSTLGIDLNGDGVSQNDPSDLDSGPNDMRNFPIITSVQEVGSQIMVHGVLPSFMPQMQTVELFRAMPSPSGYGEGGQYLGQTTPDTQGQFSMMMPRQSEDAPLATALANGDVITATATDIASNTSEFSPNFVIGVGDTIAPSAVMLSPNGGELYEANQSVTIKWRTYDNVGVVAQDVLISTDGGQTFRPLQTNLAGTIQQITVNMPVVIDTVQAVVCVVARDGNGNEVRDCSDGPFAIFGRDNVPPSVTIASPNGGEIIAAGQRFTIQWMAGDDRPGVSCTVLLSTDGGATYTTLAAGLTGTQSYEWFVPAVLSSARARIRVACRDTSGQVTQDESDANFAIDQKHPEVKVDFPAGGDVVLRFNDNPVRIEWTSSDDVGVASHDILLSIDEGRTFDTVIASGLPGTARSFDWVMPRHTKVSKAAIRIVTRDFVGRISQDDSDRTFILFRP